MELNNYLIVLTSYSNLVGLEVGKDLFYLITMTELTLLYNYNNLS